VKVEACDGCGVNLATRPVLTTIKQPQAKSGVVKKHVHKKPAQLVIVVRVEGSSGLTDEMHKLNNMWKLRLCVKCIDAAGSVPAAIAVALDKRQEAEAT
jgi:aspartate aminotransferase-like enzyme